MSQIFGYKEVCEGISRGEFNKTPIYFQHASIFDQCLIDEERDRHKKWAKSKLLDSHEEAIKRIIKSGAWPQAREDSLKSKLEDYQNMWGRRAKLNAVGIVNAVRAFHQAINEMRAEIDTDFIERGYHLPETQESYANKKALDYEIFLTARAADGNPFFTEESFEDISEDELSDLRNLYSRLILKFDDQFFDKLAVSSFFYSIFDNYVANPGDFFKKAAPELTVFQLNLLRSAKRYNEVLKIAYDAPEDFYEDPKMLETYAIVKNNAGPAERDADASEVAETIASSKKKRT